jgi:hypothetical protein
MFCKECGNQVEQFARFCSKCGHEVADAAPAPVQPIQPRPHDMNMHVNILAWLLIGSGVLTGIMALLILFASQIVHHLTIPWPPSGDFIGNTRVGAHFISWIISVVGLAAGALAAGVTAAGVGLLQYRDWARTLAIIMAVFLLFHFPIGTATAIYAFWVLFSREGQSYFKARSATQSS